MTLSLTTDRATWVALRRAALDQAHARERRGTRRGHPADAAMAARLRAVAEEIGAVIACDGPCISCEPDGTCSHPEGTWYGCPFRALHDAKRRAAM